MCPSLDGVPTGFVLAAAVAFEVLGTVSLKLSDGFRSPAFAAGVLVAYAIALTLFARVLARGVGLGVAYGTFTASGLIGATVLSTMVFAEPISAAQGAGLVVLLAGVLVLQVRAPEAAQ